MALPAYPLPPVDLLDSLALTAIAATGGDVTLAAQGKVTVAGLGTPIYIRRIQKWTKTTGVVAVQQVTTPDTTSATVVQGVTQTMTVKTLWDNQIYTVQVVPGASPTTTTLKAQFVAAVNAQLSTILTAASVSSPTFSLTEVGNQAGFTVSFSDAGITQVATTAHVQGSGSLAEVQQYNAAASGTIYTKYDAYVLVPVQGGSDQSLEQRLGHIIIWANEGDADFANFNTKLHTNTILAGGITAAADVIPYVAGA